MIIGYMFLSFLQWVAQVYEGCLFQTNSSVMFAMQPKLISVLSKLELSLPQQIRNRRSDHIFHYCRSLSSHSDALSFSLPTCYSIPQEGTSLNMPIFHHPENVHLLGRVRLLPVEQEESIHLQQCSTSYMYIYKYNHIQFKFCQSNHLMHGTQQSNLLSSKFCQRTYPVKTTCSNSREKLHVHDGGVISQWIQYPFPTFILLTTSLERLNEELASLLPSNHRLVAHGTSAASQIKSCSHVWVGTTGSSQAIIHEYLT